MKTSITLTDYIAAEEKATKLIENSNLFDVLREQYENFISKSEANYYLVSKNEIKKFVVDGKEHLYEITTYEIETNCEDCPEKNAVVKVCDIKNIGTDETGFVFYNHFLAEDMYALIFESRKADGSLAKHIFAVSGSPVAVDREDYFANYFINPRSDAFFDGIFVYENHLSDEKEVVLERSERTNFMILVSELDFKTGTFDSHFEVPANRFMGRLRKGLNPKENLSADSHHIFEEGYADMSNLKDFVKQLSFAN